jgi:hypothetical protein
MVRQVLSGCDCFGNSSFESAVVNKILITSMS